MKTSKIFKLIMVLIASVAITSCIQDDDYTVPSSLGLEENAKLDLLLTSSANEVTIAEVKAMYNPDPNGDGVTTDAMPFEVDTEIYVKGYVSSSDKTGNFFKEFYLQDSPSSPTGALKIILNQVDSYNKYNLGREVYINLKDLFIGEERVGSGVITIGGDTETDQYGTTVEILNETKVENKILRSTVTMEMTPLVVTFSGMNSDHVGLLVSVENIEFANDLAGLRYFDSSEVYDTKRTMQDCGGFNYTEFQLETSGFSSFKNEPLPLGNGTITAVVSKTFDGASLVLAINSLEDVNMTGERCSLLDPSDFTTIFSEDFESATNNTNLDFTGWTNFAEEGSYLWREKTFSGNGYTEFSSYNSGDDENIGWLVTPSFDMDAQDNEFLNFKAAQHHLDSPDNTLEVFVSTDYDGSDVLSATWTQVAANLPSQANDWYEFVDSGLINLSSYTGTLYVAFKFVGSGNNTSLDGGYQIDDFSIIASN